MSLLACALPMLLSLRLWGKIPLNVPSGIVGDGGAETFLPRWAVAFGLPALLCVFHLLGYGLLQLNPKNNSLIRRFVGQWGFTCLSVLLCSGMILEATGETASLSFFLPRVLGLGAMMVGAHLWDCPRDARIALRFSFTESEGTWKAVHRFGAWVWLVAGLGSIAGGMLTASSTAMTIALLLFALFAPMAYGLTRTNKLN